VNENQSKLIDLVAHEAEKNHGVVFLATLKENGFPNQASLNYLKKEGFERISRGIYLSPLYYEDEMYVFQKRFAKGVYSHETALYLHGLSDVCQHRFKNVVFHRFKKCRFSAVSRCCISPASAEKQRVNVVFHRSINEDRPVFFSWNAVRVPVCSLSCDKSFR